MKIAVLSGKGGTGKTTVSASLALSLPYGQYIDCDVEEPNGYIFLAPEFHQSIPVDVQVPEVENSRCNGCGRCGRACQFNAIAVVKGRVLVFPEMCHHCGACVLACPDGAVREIERTIGVVESNAEGTFLQGRLNIGEPVTVPIITELKKHIKEDATVILDCPPGASCTVVRTIEDCDYGVLVTEPTPFGLHDLKIAVELVRKMGLPFGVVLNKASDNSKIINDYCHSRGIEILLEIPFSREIARDYSRGILPVHNDFWKEDFKELYEKIERSAGN